MSKTPLSIWRPAPRSGQDNEYVYKELLGYSDDEYQWFVDNDHAGEQFLFQRQPKRPEPLPELNLADVDLFAPVCRLPLVQDA